MLRSLEAIRSYKEGQTEITKEHAWLELLASAEERIVNLEHVQSLQELARSNPVLDYVENTLARLESMPLSFWIKELLEDVLAWSEAAKGGTLRQRLVWREQGIQLMAHNMGSAELYRRHLAAAGQQETMQGSRFRVVHTLIATHGLVGQTLRGEVGLAEHRPLADLIEEGLLESAELKRLLMPLNECVIAAVSVELWQQLKHEAELLIDRIVRGDLDESIPLKERLRRLRSHAIDKGEPFDTSFDMLEANRPEVLRRLQTVERAALWFVEAALSEFSFGQFVQMMAIVLSEMPQVGPERVHISFERLMNTLYYDYKGRKKMNVYKKRMIEAYLNEYTDEQLLNRQQPSNAHLTHRVETIGTPPHTVYMDFVFSPAATKLIEFCVEAEKSPLYERAVLMLYDLFGLRRDAYDRFHNEDDYLETMNRTADYKQVILDYVTGSKVLDIGPGGGVMLDLLEERFPEKQAVGIDISSNVIEALERKKQLENRRWTVRQGDALSLKNEFAAESFDTIIFSSILHELYSYIEFEGRRFNLETVGAALRSAYDVLSIGGRIIIRDGIMSEPAEQRRIIRFLEPDGMAWLERYAADFAGRAIRYERLGSDEALMPVNDAMEFLYTYTWGEQAYVHEVQEQFGYFTPSAYISFIRSLFGESVNILVSRHYLQEGYTEALASRIELMDEERKPADLPDSTFLLVLEKI